MALKGKSNEEKIWNFLKEKGLNDFGAAALMGNLYAESGLKPCNLQNTYEKKLGFSDTQYTAAVDSGKYTGFIRDCAGYGIAQWTHWSRKEALLEYAKSCGASIGDLEAQLGYLYNELSRSFASVLKVLKTASSVREASDVVLLKFERPADQSEAAKQRRASYGQKYYDMFAAKSAPTLTMTTTIPNDRVYTVKRGDTLSKIAAKYNLTYKELAAYNGITNHNLITVGQAIRIPAWEPKIGDIVRFNGNVHYSNSSALIGKKCVGGKARIVGIRIGKKHPYQLVRIPSAGATVYGWVDAGTFTKA